MTYRKRNNKLSAECLNSQIKESRVLREHGQFMKSLVDAAIQAMQHPYIGAVCLLNRAHAATLMLKLHTFSANVLWIFLLCILDCVLAGYWDAYDQMTVVFDKTADFQMLCNTCFFTGKIRDNKSKHRRTLEKAVNVPIQNLGWRLPFLEQNVHID